ncbi:MAG: hypothetical protein ABSB88_05055 [Bryobacteraceae bacterium]
MGKPFNLDQTPFEVLDRRITATNIALDVSSTALSESRGQIITRRDVENGLITVLGLDEIYDLLDRDIDSAQILSLLSDCDFVRLRPEKLCEIVVEESIIPAGVPLFLTEADVKLKGEKWTVHRYDADPFPSNPHAHCYSRALKLHLGNGAIYQNKSKVPCGHIGTKDLVRLRELVVQKNANIALPALTV